MGQNDPKSTAQSPVDKPRSAKPPKLYREGDYLVVPQRWVDLPAGCVVCGSPESGRLRLKIRKASRILALFVPIGAVIYYSMPTARLRAGLCKYHRNREILSRLPTQTLVGAAIAVLALCLYYRTPEALLIGYGFPTLFLEFAMIYAIARRKLLRAAYADRSHIWLAGVDPSILAQAQAVAPATDVDRP